MKRMKRWAAVYGLMLLVTACGAQPGTEVILMTNTNELEKVQDKPEQQTEAQTDAEVQGSEAVQEEVSVITVHNPSYEYYLSEQASKRQPAGEREPVRWEELSSERNQITDTEDWFQRNGLTLASAMGYSWLEQEWQELQLEQALDDGEYVYAIYGENKHKGYLLRLYEGDTQACVISLDFSEYRYGEEIIPEDIDFVEQGIQWARVKDGVLYLSVGHATYARSCPQNAYLLALRLSDGVLLWKSEPLVSNAKTFEIIEDEIICAYGFTDETDTLNQVDLATGEVRNRIPLETQAEYIIWKDGRLYVRTYDTDYVFRPGESGGGEN